MMALYMWNPYTISVFNRQNLFVCLAVAVSFFLGLAQGKDLAEEWKSGELWKMNRKEAPYRPTFADIALGEVLYSWGEETQEDAPAAGEATGEESKVEKLQKVVCMVYNRGDDGEIDKKKFDEKFDACVAALDEVSGKKGRQIQLSKGKTGVKVKAWQWQGEQGVIRLEGAVTIKKKERLMEFIRLSIAPDIAMMDKGGSSDKIGRKDLKTNVTKEDDGTVWIKGIPMVDQGDKGYCVPATVARVFAYYGMDKVDMHALAALCETGTGGGTSTAKMAEALKTIGRTFRLKIKTLNPPSGSHHEFIKDYNREAKRQGKHELEEASAPGHAEWFEGMDAALWAEVRAKKATDVKKWMAPIRKSIDSGVPVLWNVFASGLYNREWREGGGAGSAHMRMIIGYNVEKNTIIYSDSWGEWATRRVMTMPEAYSVTTHVYVLSPSS